MVGLRYPCLSELYVILVNGELYVILEDGELYVTLVDGELYVILVYSELYVILVYSELYVILVYSELYVILVYSELYVILVYSELYVILVYSELYVILVYDDGAAVAFGYRRTSGHVQGSLVHHHELATDLVPRGHYPGQLRNELKPSLTWGQTAIRTKQQQSDSQFSISPPTSGGLERLSAGGLSINSLEGGDGGVLPRQNADLHGVIDRAWAEVRASRKKRGSAKDDVRPVFDVSKFKASFSGRGGMLTPIASATSTAHSVGVSV
ncbi:hypothetical protein BaRGS_00005390, partial [Batillaria attramentaria]